MINAIAMDIPASKVAIATLRFSPISFQVSKGSILLTMANPAAKSNGAFVGAARLRHSQSEWIGLRKAFLGLSW